MGDVIVGDALPPARDTVVAPHAAMQRDHDHIRRMLICEPRGAVARGRAWISGFHHDLAGTRGRGGDRRGRVQPGRYFRRNWLMSRTAPRLALVASSTALPGRPSAR